MALTAVDGRTDRAALLVQERAVVGLSTWLLDAAHGCARSGRRLQLLTPATSRLTLPAADLLRSDGADWIVRSVGRDYNGFTGAPTRWDGAAFAPCGPPPDTVVPPALGMTVVDVAVRLPAAESTELGGVLEECVDRLTGGAVAGWGVAEPVSERWSRARLTEFCRERAPRPTKVVVVAPGVLGTVAVAVAGDGLLERTRIGVGITTTTPDKTALAALWAGLAARYDVLHAGASVCAGGADCTMGPVSSLAERTSISRVARRTP